MWIDKKEQSKWAWEQISQCNREGKDDKEYREMLDSPTSLQYCAKYSDLPEVRKNITQDEDAYKYCKLVKIDEEVRNRIKASRWALKYCLTVEDHPLIRSRIVNGREAFQYCTVVNDCPEIAEKIQGSRWIGSYMEWKMKKGEIVNCTFKYDGNKTLTKKVEEEINDKN